MVKQIAAWIQECDFTNGRIYLTEEQIAWIIGQRLPEQDIAMELWGISVSKEKGTFQAWACVRNGDAGFAIDVYRTHRRAEWSDQDGENAARKQWSVLTVLPR